MNDNAARLCLESLAPVFGLHVDPSRVVALEPLAESLLRMGEQLVQTTQLATEPIFIGGGA